MLVRTAASYDTWILRNNDFGVEGNVKFITEENVNSWPQKSLQWIRKLSSTYLHSTQVDMWNRFWDINKYMAKKLPLVKIRENKLFRHRPEAIGRPVIYTHCIYMNEHIIFWMLRAQITRICNVEIIFEYSLPLLTHFQNGCLEKNAENPKIEISVSQHLIITDIQNLSLDICFWGRQIRWY